MLTSTEQLNKWLQQVIEDKLDQPTITLTPEELCDLANQIAGFVVNECITLALANDDPFTALDIENRFRIK